VVEYSLDILLPLYTNTFSHTFFPFLPYSTSSLDDESINPINAVNSAVSNDNNPAIAEPAYGVTKYSPVFPITLATGLKFMHYMAPRALCSVFPA